MLAKNDQFILLYGLLRLEASGQKRYGKKTDTIDLRYVFPNHI